MKILRIASLPLLHRGKTLTNSPIIWLGGAASAGIVAFSYGHFLPLYVLSAFCALASAFWFSARLTRELGLRALGSEVCPKCQTQIGESLASMAFAGYTRRCVQFIQESKGAFSIDLGSPLDFVCPACDEHVFFDYLDSNTVHLDENAEQGVDPNA